MVAVADQLSPNARSLHSGGNHAGSPVRNGGHGIVQVGQMPGPGIEHRPGMVIVGIRMGNGDGAELGGLLGEFLCTGELRSHVHDLHQAVAALPQLPEALKIRVLQIVRVLGAALLIGKVGSLHLNAPQDAQALRLFLFQLNSRGEGLLQNIIGQGHGGRCKGGHAVLGIEGCHFFQALIVAVGKVRAGVAVAVNFHQAGDYGSALEVYRVRWDIPRKNRAKLSVLHFESAGTELEIRAKNPCIFVKHEHLLLSQQFILIKQ